LSIDPASSERYLCIALAGDRQVERGEIVLVEELTSLAKSVSEHVILSTLQTTTVSIFPAATGPGGTHLVAGLYEASRDHAPVRLSWRPLS
jgi:hypothetical protein